MVRSLARMIGTSTPPVPSGVRVKDTNCIPAAEEKMCADLTSSGLCPNHAVQVSRKKQL